MTTVSPDAQDRLDKTEAAKEAARAAHLRYVSDQKPGIGREKDGDHFRYIAANGSPITDGATLERIRKLVLPPAYTEVWICPLPNGHLQATGKDARGRKQYRYHERWRSVRDENKYDRMLAFGEALPKIRAQVQDDLKRSSLPREKALAAVVHLLETSRIRVGNDEYARTNQSYGLTTMHNKHADVTGQTVHFRFKGKSGKVHDIDVRDARIARIVKKCQDLPGQELFGYVDGASGETKDIASDDVNQYLHEIAGQEFTAKDFRTWSGTVLCALSLLAMDECDTATTAKKNIVEAIKEVSAQLGNTPAVCRKSYIHPAILDCYSNGTLAEGVKLPEDVQEMIAPDAPQLSPQEQAVLAFLREQPIATPAKK